MAVIRPPYLTEQVARPKIPAGQHGRHDRYDMRTVAGLVHSTSRLLTWSRSL
jgi:hypothetical protein